MYTGWIKSYRSILDWEWWGDHNTTRLWIYLLHAVNYEPGKWRGKVIEPGQKVTSLGHLAEQTGLSIKAVRNALDKLISTGEIEKKGTNRYTLITVRNWEKFQDEEANKGQTKGKQRATIKEVKKERNKDISEIIESLTPSEKLRSAITDWVEMRTKNKKPPTERAIELAYKKAKSFARTEDEAVEIFNQSTLNNWAGVFPLKE